MAKANVKTVKTPVLYDKPWKHAVAAVVALLLAYPTALWAVDSGKLLVYAALLVLAYLASRHIVQAVIGLRK